MMMVEMKANSGLRFFASLLIVCLLFSCVFIEKSTQSQLGFDTPRDALESARWYFKKEKYKKAVEAYDIVLTRYKDSSQEAAWALYERSYCYYKMKKIEQAEQGFISLQKLYVDEAGPVSLAEKMITKIALQREDGK